MSEFSILAVGSEDIDWIARVLIEHWGSVKIVTRGTIYDASQLPGFKATIDSKPVGLITYHIAGDECELISLNSLKERAGIGSALLEHAKRAAIDQGCNRIWLITTNDNIDAITFYAKRGFRLVSVHRDAIKISRRLKPSIPALGNYNIPIRDELEFEMLLSQ